MSSKRMLVIVIFGLLLSFAASQSAAGAAQLFRVSSTWLPASCGTGCSNPDPYPLDPASSIMIDTTNGTVFSSQISIKGNNIAYQSQQNGTGFTLLNFSGSVTSSQGNIIDITLQLYFPGSLVGYAGGTLCSATNPCSGGTSNEVAQCISNPFVTCTPPTSVTFNLSLGQLTPPTKLNPVPFVNQPLVPSAAAPGSSAFTLTVNGTGFVSGATVNWNGAALTTTFVNSSQLTAAVPASNIATVGTAEITVLNPTPSGGPSNVAFFPISNPTRDVAFQAGAPLNGSNNADTGVDSSYVVADFGTGKLDLIVSSSLPGGGNIPHWSGNGDGTFQAPIELQAQTSNSTSTVGSIRAGATGDFNSDGKVDFIAVGYVGNVNGRFQEGAISFLAGNGDGTFQPLVSSVFPTLTWIGPGVFVGDLNGDGHLDVVAPCKPAASNPNGTTMQWGICAFLGYGDGTFSLAFSRFYSLPFIVSSITLGDFNGDGKLDIIGTGGYPASSFSPSYVGFLAGNGDGTFAPDQLIYETTDSINGPGLLSSADLNHDGKLDLVLQHDCAAQPSCALDVDFLVGNGDGTFQPPITAHNLPTFSPIFFGDFNTDGNFDVSVLNTIFLLNNGGSTSYSIPQSPNQQIPMAVGDFNGDGRLDLMCLFSSHFLLQPLLQVAPPPDFVVAVSSDSQTVTAGGTATFTVTITGVNGFNGVVTPSQTGFPAGTTVSYNPATVTGSGTIVITITTSATTPKGTYPLAGSLTSGSIVHSGTLTLIVQ